jgi:hypothetical protein
MHIKAMCVKRLPQILFYADQFILIIRIVNMSAFMNIVATMPKGGMTADSRGFMQEAQYRT